MAKERPFAYIVVGYGGAPSAALAEAEGKLPHPIREPHHYARLHTANAVEVAKGSFKVEVKYDLTNQNSAEGKAVRTKPSSFGGGDPFACTRDLTDRL